MTNMTRDEMINVLIEHKITDWVYCGMTDMLEEFLLFCAWKPLDSYTDKELTNEVESFGEEQIKEYLESCRERRIQESKKWEENKKRIGKWEVDHRAIDPFG